MAFLFNEGPVQKKVELATNELLMGPDWGANMELCDEINRDRNGGQEHLKAIEKRLGSNKPHVVNLALQLLGACVSNCGYGFHRHVHDQRFLNEVVKLTKHKDPSVRDLALTMIQTWAEAFAPVKELPGFQVTYQKLRQAGVQFPARDMTSIAPVFTPRPSVQTPQKKEEKKDDNKLASVTVEYIAKIKTELQEVLRYVAIGRDHLLKAENNEAAAKDEVLGGVIKILKEAQARLTRLLVELEHEHLIDLFIQVNEHVRVVLDWYKAKSNNQDFNAPELPIPEALRESDGHEKKQDVGAKSSPRGDVHDEFDAIASRSPQSAAQPAPADDEFSALASRSTEKKQHKKTPSQELEELLGLGSSSGAPSSAAPAAASGVSDQELDDLLGLNGPPQQNAPSSAKKDPSILHDIQ